MKSLLIVAFIFFGTQGLLAADKTTPQVIEMKVTAQGFEPSHIEVPAGKPVVLKVTRTTDVTCATEIKIKDKKIQKDLPLNQTVTVDVGPLKKGKHVFSCAMEMIKGDITAK